MTWEGCCQSFSSLLNRLLQLGGCQALRFFPESPEALSFCIHSLPATWSSITEKKWNLKTSSDNVAVWCFIVWRTSALCSRTLPCSVSAPQPLGEVFLPSFLLRAFSLGLGVSDQPGHFCLGERVNRFFRPILMMLRHAEGEETP